MGIINNYLINKLLIKQNNLINFFNNIQLNDYNDKKNKNNINDNIFLINKQNLNIIDEIENKEIFKNNEEKDEENKKSYKKLFQITEYLYYYINKNEKYYYHINNNNIFDDENQVIKINNRNIKNSIKIKQNFFKNIKKNDNDTIKNEKNISINMINGKDITYLWYMEAKNKNNKSINYTINNKYDELFLDSYI